MKRDRGLVVDRGYLKIRIWPWGKENKPYVEHFGRATPANIGIARYKLRDYRNKIALGKFDIEKPAKALLFKDAVPIFLEKHKNTPDMRYQTKQLSAFFGGYFLHDITADLIKDYRRKREVDVTFATTNKNQAILSSLFEKFREWNATNGVFSDKIRLPAENPCQFVTKPTEIGRKRRRVLAPEEWDRLKPALNEELLDHCKMAIYSSLRLKDISRLSGKVIEGDIIRDLQAKNAAKGIEYQVPLTESLRAIALRIAARPYLSSWTVQRTFRGACDAINIRDCTFRDLRRTGLSWMDKLGARRTVLRDRAGHTDSKTTDLYLGSEMVEQLEAIRTLEDTFK